MSSSLRSLAIFPHPFSGDCELCSGGLIDLVWIQDDPTAICSPLYARTELPSASRSSGDVGHHRKPAPRVKLAHPTHLQRIVAQKNFKEWIA